MKSYITVLTQKYMQFSGRASRSEYWIFSLVNIVILMALSMLGGFFLTTSENPGSVMGLIPYGLFALAVLLPSIAVTVRRLHDTSRAGWWLLIGFVPFIGAIWLFVLLVLDSSPGSNEYGAHPYGDADGVTTV